MMRGELKKASEIDVTEGSGNVFDDLGFEDAKEHQVKAELTYQIYNILKSSKFTQREAAKLLRLAQPDVSALMNGRFTGFSLERLISLLFRLGRDVEIVVKPRARDRGKLAVHDTTRNEPTYYEIQRIEGINYFFRKKLSEAGINDTKKLLVRCSSAKGRKEVAAETGLDDKRLLKWVNLADLMRISGIGEHFSELLEASGVDTVKELRNRRADNLSAKMKEINAARKLARATPSERKVARWVELARSLPPVITH